jgi:hypothetical protein
MAKRGPGRLRLFNKEGKLAIVKEGETNGVITVCAKYAISVQT